MTPTTEQMHLTVVVSGQGTPATVDRHWRVERLIQESLAKTNNVGQPSSQWELRTMDGRLLEWGVRVDDAGIVDGMTLFLSPRAGVGATDPTTVAEAREALDDIVEVLSTNQPDFDAKLDAFERAVRAETVGQAIKCLEAGKSKAQRRYWVTAEDAEKAIEPGEEAPCFSSPEDAASYEEDDLHAYEVTLTARRVSDPTKAKKETERR